MLEDNQDICILERISSQRKKGPPNNVVITPTGISAGAITKRPMPSHKIKNAPPNKQLAGINHR